MDKHCVVYRFPVLWRCNRYVAAIPLADAKQRGDRGNSGKGIFEILHVKIIMAFTSHSLRSINL